nr:staphylocoagulase repeat protein [uncultured Mediterranean phage uvMED]|tara:strand:+ start:141 stop:602 length:462 start_codon:yes stop_codon:yes gene_type:complete
MATVYSTQRTNNRASPVVMNKANELGGRVRIAHGVYEASSLASGDVIELFILPDGARLLEGSLAHDAMGSSTTLSVGYAAHTNAAGTAVSAAAAAYKAAAASTSAQKVDILATIALGSGTETDTNEDGVAVTATMGGAAGTGTIEVTIKYVVD